MLVEPIRKFWGLVQELSGDDAYERYLRHHAEAHPDTPPLDRRTFFTREQERKWSSLKRCC